MCEVMKVKILNNQFQVCYHTGGMLWSTLPEPVTAPDHEQDHIWAGLGRHWLSLGSQTPHLAVMSPEASDRETDRCRGTRMTQHRHDITPL